MTISNTLLRSRWMSAVAAVLLALSVTVFVACGGDEDTTATDDTNDSTANGESVGDVAAITIMGPDQVMIGAFVPLTAVPKDKDGKDITQGESDVLEVLNGTQWSSSDESIATVKVQDLVPGATNATALVTGVKEGKVTITAQYKGLKDSVDITVINPLGAFGQ